MNQKILWDYGGNRKIWPPRAFTLVEIMVVIAIIGILGTALFPSLSGYIVRTRDTSRIADITDIAFSLETYRQEYEKYPPHEAGCYPYTSLSGVFLTRKLESPSGSGYDEGCGSSGKYGYGISTGETINILMARMENPYGGNYVSSGELLLGLTGTLTSLGLANTLYYTKRSTGSTYVFPSAAGDIILSAGGTPPAPSDGVCSAASAGACSAGYMGSLTNGGVCGTTATWTCNGTNGGANVNCSLQNPSCLVNGSCNNAVQFACSSGTSVANTAGSCGGNSTWSCLGSGGGTDATNCSRVNPVCACTIGSGIIGSCIIQ